jgi:hypothetical protein
MTTQVLSNKRAQSIVPANNYRVFGPTYGIAAPVAPRVDTEEERILAWLRKGQPATSEPTVVSKTLVGNGADSTWQYSMLTHETTWGTVDKIIGCMFGDKRTGADYYSKPQATDTHYTLEPVYRWVNGKQVRVIEEIPMVSGATLYRPALRQRVTTHRAPRQWLTQSPSLEILNLKAEEFALGRALGMAKINSECDKATKDTACKGEFLPLITRLSERACRVNEGYMARYYGVTPSDSTKDDAKADGIARVWQWYLAAYPHAAHRHEYFMPSYAEGVRFVHLYRQDREFRRAVGKELSNGVWNSMKGLSFIVQGDTSRLPLFYTPEDQADELTLDQGLRAMQREFDTASTWTASNVNTWQKAQRVKALFRTLHDNRLAFHNSKDNAYNNAVRLNKAKRIVRVLARVVFGESLRNACDKEQVNFQNFWSRSTEVLDVLGLSSKLQSSAPEMEFASGLNRGARYASLHDPIPAALGRKAKRLKAIA